MSTSSLTRRAVLKTAALAPPAFAASLAAPFGVPIRRQALDGNLGPLGPGRKPSSPEDLPEWAEKEKVELTVDLITSNGDKDLLTLMAEGQAKAGHDIMGLRTW